MIFNSDFISNKVAKSPKGEQHDNQDPKPSLQLEQLDERHPLST